MDEALGRKLRDLRGLIGSHGSALVSYSGGVDSTLLAFLTRETLGDRMLAAIVASPLLPPRELTRAIATAKRLGLPLEVAEADEISLPDFEENPPDRCYRCKRFRLGLMRDLAERRGFEVIMEGSNRDDAFLHRPGRRANLETGALSPLEEAGFGKADVRAAARELELPNWDAPSRPCLATRFPYGTTLDRGLISRVDAAEEWLESLGIRQLRVRVEGRREVRIEVERDDMDLLRREDVRERLTKKFRSLGFRRVSLDLEGFRSGSMDDTGGDRKVEDLYIE